MLTLRRWRCFDEYPRHREPRPRVPGLSSLPILIAIAMVGLPGDATAQSQRKKPQSTSPKEALVKGRAADFWIKQLEDPDAGMRLEAAQALTSLGPVAVAGVPVLRKALLDEDNAVSFEAVQALGRMGPAAKEAIPDLFARLDRADSRNKSVVLDESTMHTILAIGPDAVPPLVARFSGKHGRARRVAYEALCAMGPKAKVAVPELVDLLKADESTRKAAGEILNTMKDDAYPALLAALEDPDHDYAATVLASMAAARYRRPTEPDGKPATVDLLIKLLDHPEPNARLHAAIVMRSAVATEATLAALMRALGDEDERVRQEVVQETLKCVQHSLKPDDEDRNRKLIATAMRRAIGTAADSKARARMAGMLPRLDWPMAATALPELLDDGDESVRDAVAHAIRARPRTLRATAYDAALDDPRIAVRAAAIDLLEHADPAEEAATRLGNVVLKERNTEMRLQAISVLRSMKEVPWRAVPQLIAAMADKEVGEAAAKTLQQMGAAEALVSALRSDSERAQELALEKLKEMGPAAKKAVPELLNMRDGSNEKRKAYASEILNSIKRGGSPPGRKTR